MAHAFALKNGTILLSTEAPGGLYNAVQLKKIAALCDGDVAIVKATEDQRLALFVKESDAPRIVNELKAIGLGIRHYQKGLHQPISCIGELCPDHEQDALGSAMDLTKALQNIQLSSALKIGINGCAKCCVPCHTLDISVIGDATGYRVSLGGKTSQLPEMASFMAEGIPAAKLPEMLTKVVTAYKKHAQGDESLQEVMERVGTSPFVDALAPYSQDASGGMSDPFGASEPETMGGEEELLAEPEIMADDHSVAFGEEVGTAQDEILGNDIEPDALSPSLDETDGLLGEPGPDLSFSEDLEEISVTDDIAPPAKSVAANAADAETLEDDISLNEPMRSGGFDIDPMGNDDLLIEDEILIDETPAKAAPAVKPAPATVQSLTERFPDAEVINLTDNGVDDLEDDLALAPGDVTLDDGIAIEDDNGEQIKAIDESALLEDNFLDAEPELLGDEPREAEESIMADEPILAAESMLAEEDDLKMSDSDVENLSEEGESEFENSLAKDIEEESDVPDPGTHDANSAEREEALSMLDSEPMLETDNVAAYDHLENIELESLEADELIEDNEELISDFNEETAHHQAKMPQAPTPPRSESTGAGTFQGFAMEGNTLTLRFGQGLELLLEQKAFGQNRRTLNFGSKSITFWSDARGFCVEIDGVSLVYPKSQAS